jgi:segregation and condensation protein B
MAESHGAEEEDVGDSLGPGEADLSEEAETRREGPGLVGTAELAPEHLRGALEALILVSDKPVAAVRLARLTGQDLGTIRVALAELAREYESRGIVLDEIAGGFQFRTSPRYAPFVRMLVQQKPTKLSRAQLEALSIIAYRQPVTRPEIDDVRGVDSGSALKLLLERNLIKIIGKKEEAGRPMLYGTTPEFLELFGLKNLRDLPTLREFAELNQESRDIYERRIGEPLPGQGQGMDLQTHYEAQEGAPEPDEAAEEPAPSEEEERDLRPAVAAHELHAQPSEEEGASEDG